MKKLIFFLMIIIPAVSFSQDTTKVEQYCELVATARLLSSKVTIDINYGEERKFFKDYRIRDESGKAVKFNSVVDAINYLGQQGWKLVNAFPINVGNGPAVYHYVFKKEFLKADVDKAENTKD